jgi:hypothetical protein
MKQNILKRITSSTFVLPLIPISSLTTLAVSCKGIDFALLTSAKAISQRYYADLEMEKLGMDLNQMLKSSRWEEFFEETVYLFSDIIPVSSEVSSTVQALSEMVH